MKKRIIIGITGASGAIYGIRALQIMMEMPEVESHLIISAAAHYIIVQETDWAVTDVKALANKVYDPEDVGASIASGSFTTSGMLIAPCSVKTLSAVANSFTTNLISRAADVQLKEDRPIVMMIRETPLHLGHMRLMTRAAQNGAVIMPPVPIFYSRPNTVDDIILDSIGRALSRLGIENDFYYQWKEVSGDG